ncbi:MAG: hypothetical protein R3F19_01185 [Verrucomicrobiales bacterium]
MQKHEIYAVFDCLALRQSPYCKQLAGADVTIPSLLTAEHLASCLLRLPMESSLTSEARQRGIATFLSIPQQGVSLVVAIAGL